MAAHQSTFPFPDHLPEAAEEPSEGPTVIRIKKTWASILGAQLICAECKTPCPRTGPSQRYCEPCSEARAVARKAKWARAHPPDPAAARARARGIGERKRSEMGDRGAAISESSRARLEEVFADESGMAWVRRLAVPFSYAMSKNHMNRLDGNGHVYLRRESKEHRAALARAVAVALSDAPLVVGKLWISLIVHKPNHRGDAINVLDLVCDGIKDAIHVDDRWFAIKEVDWRIVKNDPELLIGIGQSVTEDHQVCSYCGRDLPYSAFVPNKGMPGGIGRACRECSVTIDRKCRGSEVGGAKLTDEKVLAIRRLAAEGRSQAEIAEEFGISRTNVSMIVRRKTWGHI